MVYQFITPEFFKSGINRNFIEFDIMSAIFRHEAYLREPPVLIKRCAPYRKHKFCDSVFVVKVQALAGFLKAMNQGRFLHNRAERQL